MGNDTSGSHSFVAKGLSREIATAPKFILGMRKVFTIQ